MKTLACLLLGLFCFTSCQKEPPLVDPSSGDQKDLTPALAIKVHILAGQSNAVGHGSLAGVAPYYADPIPGALIYNPNSGNLETLDAGVNNFAGGCAGPSAANTHGLELSFMRQMVDQVGPCVMVKRAVNGTPLYLTVPGSPNPWEAPDNIGSCNPQRTWNVNSPTSIYNDLKADCLAAKAKINALQRQADFQTLIWYQGESDANYAQRAGAWEANMRYLFTKLKRDLNAPQMKLIIMRVRNGISTLPHLGVVRQAQDNIGAAVWAESIDLDAYYLPSDVHLNSFGLISAGTIAANVRMSMP